MFERVTHVIDGIETVSLVAGRGAPLVYFHGAATVPGIDFAKAWAERFRVIAPYHPGFGESADDPRIDSFQDYVLHYLDYLDAFGLDRVRLVGLSLGGRMAATFAAQHPERIERLALVCPAGFPDPEHPATDSLRVKPEELVAHLVHDPAVVAPYLPAEPDVAFLTARYREATAMARVTWEAPVDWTLPRWLRRLTMPTLIVWGEADRIMPVGQTASWAAAIPQAEVRTFANAGHLVLDESPAAVAAIAEFMA